LAARIVLPRNCWRIFADTGPIAPEEGFRSGFHLDRKSELYPEMDANALRRLRLSCSDAGSDEQDIDEEDGKLETEGEESDEEEDDKDFEEEEDDKESECPELVQSEEGDNDQRHT
jgi:hypothetical protein